jgi:serine/threonine-protein kinase
MERRSISHYDLLEKVGQGGTGVVYRANHQTLDRTVALEFLRDSALESEVGRGRFIQEARSISRLTDRHIADIHGIKEAEGEIFLVFEYLPGGTLKSRLEALNLRDERMRPEQVAEYGEQLAEALACAHTNGIIHRDVKPANIMFARDGDLKIVDFGWSKLRGREDIAGPGVVQGTPLHVSPQQACGKRIDERSDILSLGMVLYEMASGRPPFVSDERQGIIHQLIHEPAQPIAEITPGFPPKLDAIITRALEKEPAARYQRMLDLAADLRSFRRGVSDSERVPDDIPTQTMVRRLFSSPRRMRVWAGAAAVLMVLAATALAPPPRDRLWYRLPAERHLAILPFEIIGSDPVNRAFCDGLLESSTAMLTQLGQADKNLVITPVSEIRRQSIQTAETTRKLAGADFVVRGTVQRKGSRIRVSRSPLDARKPREIRGPAVIAYDHRQPASIQEHVVRALGQLVDLRITADEPGRPDDRSASAAANQDYLQGMGYLQRHDLTGNTDKAIQFLARATQEDPRFATAYVALSDAYRSRYLDTEERSFLESARINAGSALELDSGSAGAHAAFEETLSSGGDREGAVTELRSSLATDPLNVEALRGLAKVYDSNDRVAEAEEIHERAIGLRPNDWVSLADLGIFHSSHQEYAEAEEDFHAVLALLPDSPAQHRNPGGVYICMGRRGDAERELLKSIALGPTPIAYSNLGALYIYEGRFKDAIGVLQNAVQLTPTGFRGAHILWGNLADAYRYTPDRAAKSIVAYQCAIREAEQLLAFAQNDPNLPGSFAVDWAKLGDRNQALDNIGRAMSFADGNRDVGFRRRAFTNWPALGNCRHCETQFWVVILLTKSPENRSSRSYSRTTAVDSYSARISTTKKEGYYHDEFNEAICSRRIFDDRRLDATGSELHNDG